MYAKQQNTINLVKYHTELNGNTICRLVVDSYFKRWWNIARYINRVSPVLRGFSNAAYIFFIFQLFDFWIILLFDFTISHLLHNWTFRFLNNSIIGFYCFTSFWIIERLDYCIFPSEFPSQASADRSLKV